MVDYKHAAKGLGGGLLNLTGRGLVVKIALCLLIVALLALGLWKWSEWRNGAQAGSAYAAHVFCSCRYVEGRGAENCQQEASLEADFVRITDQPEQKRVTASVFLLGNASARLKPGYGCLLEK